MFFLPIFMHIPDGFLSFAVSIIFWVISVFFIAIAIKRVRTELKDKDVPFMGVLAAAIFAGQMINFSVTGGTSGHLLGAAVATILLGPWSAVIIMTAVVSIQALIFQDGGILALGANMFNMAVLAVAVSYFAYFSLSKLTKNLKIGVYVSGFITAWISIFIASLSAALQLSLSGTITANISIPAMAGIHALIGIGEGLITVGILAFFGVIRKDILYSQTTTSQTSDQKAVIITGAIFSLILAIASPLASSHPDGLEWVAEQKNFLGLALSSPYNIIPDYVIPGINNEAAATIAAGIIGVILVFSVTYFIARSRRQQVQQN